MSEKVNRKNNCTVHFMVNEEEMNELNRRFALTNFKTKREFYRDAIFKNKIISIDISGAFRKELRELSSLVSRNSANLNQITKHINSTGVIYKKDIELIHSGLELELSFLVEFREKVSELYHQQGNKLMAVTKIHPIKTTLKKAIDYIYNGDKTDDEIYVTTHLCSRENAHKEFELTKKQFGSKTKTLAHHLIQSFAPEEVSFEEAHQVGIELCERILERKYEDVLATHIDKHHIHNHIIFNSVDVEEGKIYHSYYGSYMNIRNQSDKLCNEHNLSVIDQETQNEINEIKRRKFVNWYDWNEDKKGSSYKSKLQFDIDRNIKQSTNWQDFLSKMEAHGYEIKFGKHIAFKSKNQQRFTRAKTIGVNYTEEKIKDRILNKEKEIDNIIDIKNNEKVKSSKSYEHWATKHNLKTAASTLVEIRDKGFNSMEELERGISRLSIEKNDLKREFDKLSWEQKRIKEVVKHIQICISKREHYEGYRKNPNDKIYMMVNRKDVEAYQKSYEGIDVFLKQFPHLRHVVIGELKTKSGKNLFKKLNEHSKKLEAKQEEIIKKHKTV